MRTVICARDATDARHAAREHGIRSADMVLVDRTGRQLRGLPEWPAPGMYELASASV